MIPDALRGKITKKACPRCGGALIIRRNRATGQHFLGCEMWPKCAHTDALPEHIKMEAMGAKRLPGF